MIPKLRSQFIEESGDPVFLDVVDGPAVDARGAVVLAHLEPCTLQDVPAMDLVIERMEPSSGVGLGRPVERSLQILDFVQFGGTSHEGTHQPFPVSIRTDEVAALPSPAVVLSARLDRYYDRLRRPPGSMPTSRRNGYRARRSGGTCSQATGPGRASPVPVVTFCTFHAPYAEEFLTAAPPGSSPLPWPSPRIPGLGSPCPRPKAGPLTTRQASLYAADRTFASPKGAFDAGLRPGPFPDRAASLLPGLLATTRTGLAPAGDDELVVVRSALSHHLQLTGRTDDEVRA